LTKVFLKDLINKSIKTYISERQEDPGPSRSVGIINNNANAKKLLVPYHIYQTIQSYSDTFDFLTGEGLASDKIK